MIKIVVVNILNKLNRLVLIAGIVAALTSEHLPVKYESGERMGNIKLAIENCSEFV